MTPEVEVLVFDVLGTMVDQRAGLRAGIAAAIPQTVPAQQERLVEAWSAQVDQAQREIVAGDRRFVPGHVLSLEAATTALDGTKPLDSDDAADDLARAAWQLPAWPDSTAGLARLAVAFPLIALSNASRRELLRLNAYAGLRWHQAISVETASTYKPDARVYRLAIEAADIAPDRLLMVAAHAWDLRGAQAAGMRTAYLARPGGDPPAPADRFDVLAETLDDLAGQLGA